MKDIKVWDIYYGNLKTGIYIVNDTGENITFNLGPGLVTVINLGSELTKETYSYQLAIKEGDIYFRCTKDHNNLKFTNTNYKLIIEENSNMEIYINQFESTIREFFLKANIRRIIINKDNNIEIYADEPDLNTKIAEQKAIYDSPFRSNSEVSLSTMTTTTNAVSSPFRVITKEAYNNLSDIDKKNGELYLIKDGPILEVDAIIKFKLISLRTQDGILIKSYRMLANSVNDFPGFDTQEDMSNNYSPENLYIINHYWREDNGVIVDVIRADRDKDIFLVSDKLWVDKFYYIYVSNEGQSRNRGKLNIKTDKIIFTKNEHTNGFILKPQSFYEGWSGEYHLFTFDFTIEGLSNKPGRIEIIPLTLTLYSDDTYTSIYATVDIKMHVTYTSENSTGD